MGLLDGLFGGTLGSLAGLGGDPMRNVTSADIARMHASAQWAAANNQFWRAYQNFDNAVSPEQKAQPAHDGPELDLTADSVEVGDVPRLVEGDNV